MFLTEMLSGRGSYGFGRMVPAFSYVEVLPQHVLLVWHTSTFP